VSFLRRLLAGSKESDTGQPGVFLVGTGIKNRATQGGSLTDLGGGASSPLILGGTWQNLAGGADGGLTADL
jgi:hypothetical protein